ncbi:hypothetical protein H3C66_03305 [Patescibacteria group bacterium]|nr:hypothetical protein [Patescibacteria group bacterium]
MTASIKKSIFGLSNQEVIKIVVAFLGWRVGLFLLGALAGHFILYDPSFPYADAILPRYNLPQWLFSWANFDGVHYLTIAEKGYIGTGLIQAFFPFFPFVILRTLFILSGGEMNTLLVGLLVSNIAALASFLLWFAFLKSEYGIRCAWVGLTLLLIFPTSFFFGALYTESLFFFTIIAAFYTARRQQWALAAGLTIIATATRVVGIFLLPALLVELWLQWRNTHPKSATKQLHFSQLRSFADSCWREILLILLGGVGLLAYTAYLANTFGDPLYFLHVQSEFGAGRQESVVLYPQVAWRSLRILLTVPPQSWGYYTYFLEFITGIGGAVALFFSLWRVRLSYVLFALGAFLMPTVTGTFSSMPRYILVCFPLYLLLMSYLESRPRLFWVVNGVFVTSLAINTVLFVQGYWLS